MSAGKIDTPHGVFDYSHYLKVRAARKAAGLPVSEPQDIPRHPLCGKRFKLDGKSYLIRAVRKEWLMGYCLRIVASSSGNSHSLFYVESLDTRCPEVAEAIRHFQESAKFYPDIDLVG